MKFRSYGYSLIELLVTVGILGALSAIAIPAYQKYKEAPIKTAMKTEASELSKFLHYAQSVDGGYHHNIFSMGYKPNKNLVADAGFESARGSAPNCLKFPRAATGDFTPFLTIKKQSYDSSKIHSATRARHICDGGHCTVTDTAKFSSALPAQTFSSGHAGCKTAFSGKSFQCDCDTFRIYSRAFIRSGVEAITLANEDGVFAYSDTSNHIDLY